MLHRESITSEVFLEEVNAWHEARTYPFGNGMLLLLKDITTRKIEAERSSRLDRLESLGLLARGFAHDFNNLLTVLLGNLALAEMRFGSQSEKMGEISTAKQATLQAQNLVQQLLTFCAQHCGEDVHARPIGIGAAKIADKAGVNRVGATQEHDRDQGCHRRERPSAELRLKDPRQFCFAVRRHRHSEVESRGRDYFRTVEHG